MPEHLQPLREQRRERGGILKERFCADHLAGEPRHEQIAAAVSHFGSKDARDGETALQIAEHRMLTACLLGNRFDL